MVFVDLHLGVLPASTGRDHSKSRKDELAMARLFSLDLVSDTKMPCLLTNFNYFSRVQAAAIAPLAVCGIMFVYGLVWAARHQKKRRTNRISVTSSFVRRERKRGSVNSIIKTGMWKVAAPLLFFLDLVYPIVTRTLLQLFTCHDLLSAGRWLEVDYSIQPVNIPAEHFSTHCSLDSHTAYLLCTS